MKKEREIDFMKRVWAAKFGETGYCEECLLQGKRTPINFSPYHIAHINSKGARPDLRTVDDNVLFLCKNHHNQMDAKFEGKTREDLSMNVGQKWQHFGIKDVISVSDGITEYLNAVMPGLSIKQYSQSIDRTLFKPVDMVDKNPVIAYMPGRTQDALIKTSNVIKTFYSFFPHLSWIRFDELKGLSKEDYAERLGAASICLYTDEIAGFGTMPLEAMAMGTHVVGWTPLGGKEYMEKTNGFWAQNGDIFQLAELLGMAVERWLASKLDTESVVAEYEKTLEKYAPEKEKESLINIINEYKNERIAELSQLKR